MKWIQASIATIVILGIGLFLSAANAMSECFPDPAACIADKRRDAIIIILVTLAVWVATQWTIFRKRRANGSEIKSKRRSQ